MGIKKIVVWYAQYHKKNVQIFSEANNQKQYFKILLLS